MVGIRTVASVLPAYRYSCDQIRNATSAWLCSDPARRELFERFLATCQIEERYFAIPIEEVLTLHSAAARETIFREIGVELGCRAVRQALDQAALSAAEITDFVFTSCSVPVIPSLDASIIHRIGLLPQVRRLPLYQHGCVGGAAGLSLAARIAGSDSKVLVVAAELCSLVFQSEDFTAGNLVGSALFGDGVACAILDGAETGLQLVATQSYLIPETEMLMGYDLREDGSHLRLSRDLPGLVAAEAPLRLQNFLSQQGLTQHDVGAWLFHPGGVRILESLEATLGLLRENTHWAWEVLHKFGNMSSASILFVLERYLAETTRAHGEFVFMLGIGPGLTLEFLLFRRAR